MSEEMKPVTQVATKNPGYRFQEGHPRFGGKKKNTAAAARAMAHELGCDPLEFMMKIINADTIEQTVIVDGKKKRVEVAIPLDTRLDAAKTVVNYLYPRLTAQQISGPSDGPIETVIFDMAKLMTDPAAVEAAQTLALLLSEPDRPPAPARIHGPADSSKALSDDRDFMDDLMRQKSNGHWLK